MGILKDMTQYRIAQDLCFRFALTLRDDPSINPYNITDQEFLTQVHRLQKKYPELTHKIYQNVHEACYYRKRFNNETLEQVFGGRFTISDPYQLNKGVSDVSTVSTALIVDSITKKGYFQNQPIIVYSTPIQYKTRVYKQHQQTCAKTYVDESKAVTENTNADLRIGHRTYDIKHTDHTATAQSHLYPWTYEKIQTHSEKHLRSLLDNLNARIDLSREHKNLLATLSRICKDTSLTWPQRNALWNNFVQKVFNTIPRDYPLPMVIPMTDEPYTIQYPSGLNKVHLSPDTLDNPMLTRQAIAGVCYTFGVRHMKRAAILTEGAISEDLIHAKEDVD